MSADSYAGDAERRADSDGDWRKQADRGAVETAERSDRIGGRGHGRGRFVQVDREAECGQRIRGVGVRGGEELDKAMSGPAGQAAGDGGGTIHTLEELARLAAVLDELMSMGIGSGMTLGEFDGFVAAVAVCPDTVPASDWLTEVWGTEPEFGHPGDADAATRALLGHYNRVARVLAETLQAYAAVFDMDADGDGDGAWWDGWMLGFERGMELLQRSLGHRTSGAVPATP